MERFDYLYYRDIFGGDCSEEEFVKYSPAALDVVSLPIGEDAEDTGSRCVIRALCLEVDELIKRDGDSLVKSESLGDYSVSYSDRRSCDIASLPVSPRAVAALTRGGYLTRWA